jgi:hypothetical protein
VVDVTGVPFFLIDKVIDPVNGDIIGVETTDTIELNLYFPFLFDVKVLLKKEPKQQSPHFSSV